MVAALEDSGHVLKYPFHFITSSLLVILLVSTLLISRDIKGPDSPSRNLHFFLGSVILSLYLVQIFLGLRILF